MNSTSFGKLFTVAADGLVDAEPLYISAVKIGGVTHNVLIVATEHGTVYAYDADTGASLWQITTLKAGRDDIGQSRMLAGDAGDRDHVDAGDGAAEDGQSGDLCRRDVEGQFGQLSPASARARRDDAARNLTEGPVDISATISGHGRQQFRRLCHFRSRPI